MWYVFPTAPWVVRGREKGSWTNQQYALRDLPPNRLRGTDAARAFLTFEDPDVNLRDNYLAITLAAAEQLEHVEHLHQRLQSAGLQNAAQP